MSENPSIDRAQEVADRISLGLGDERERELTRSIFKRGVGMAVELTLFSMEADEHLLEVPAGSEETASS